MQRQLKVLCECGAQISKNWITRHKAMKVHLINMEKIKRKQKLPNMYELLN